MELRKIIWVLSILLIFTVFSAWMVGDIFRGENGNVVLIKINGEITTGSTSLLSTGASSDKIVKEIEDAKDNPYVKALLVEINSPGGSVVATREIASALKSVNKTKVCLLREVAASGAYWIATECNYIVADNFTITGSIGVSGSYLEFSDLFKKYGIDYVRLVSGEEKDIGTPYRKPTEKELGKLQSIINRIHLAFVEEVAENRNISIADVKSIADGSIFTGEEAEKLGLVDFIGDKQFAISLIKNETNLTKVKLIEPESKVNLFDILSGMLSKEMFNYMLSNQFKLKVE
jgi:protease-4